jgi:hypothetical protein
LPWTQSTRGKWAILRARIVWKIEEQDTDNRRKAFKFLVEIGDNEYDEIMTYNDLIDIVEKRNEAELNSEAEAHAYREFIGNKALLLITMPAEETTSSIHGW